MSDAPSPCFGSIPATRTGSLSTSRPQSSTAISCFQSCLKPQAVVRLGFYMGYAPPGTNPLELIALAQEAERLGYDSAWAAEAWGTDAVTVLSWLAATTTRIKVGSAIMQIPGRTPANTAMTAATLDLMSGGRVL